MGWWLLKSITWRWKCHLKYEMTMIISNIPLVLQVWYDRKDSRSMAISVSPQTSLFLGLHKFFFFLIVVQTSKSCRNPLIFVLFWSWGKYPRHSQARKNYCTSTLFNPRIINYQLPFCSICKWSRCSQRGLLRCTRWQVPHWSRGVPGDPSYIMRSSYRIHLTIIIN